MIQIALLSATCQQQSSKNNSHQGSHSQLLINQLIYQHSITVDALPALALYSRDTISGIRRFEIAFMNESQYTDQLDALMVAIEDAIEEAELDIDYETAAGILTLTCPDGSKVILSRQTPLLQLWLAAKSGGFHFDYSEEAQAWVIDSNGKLFMDVLNRCLSEQCGETITLDIVI